MKKWLIGLLVVLIVIVALVLLVFQATKGLTGASREFFSLVEKGKVEEAYISTAKEFQAATSLEEFRGFLEYTTLDKFEQATWETRSISGNTGKLIGSIKTRDGGVVPLEIDLVKEEGRWKILSLRKAAAGLAEKEKKGEEPAGEKQVPSDEVLSEMVNESVLLLGNAINRKDFSDFYNQIAKLWQSQTDEPSLRTAFQDFIEKQIDLTIVASESPVLSEKPFIDGDGVLNMKGYYPTRPYAVHFELRFLYEYPEWKLAGIHITTN